MRNKQGITIAALIIAIIGLSIGFAAFSNTLTIRSTATVTPTNTLSVVFSTANNQATAGNISPSSATYGGTANINSSDLRILENLHATFTEPGQSVTYSGFYVYNNGNYQAQLTGIEFSNIENKQVFKECVAATKDSNNQDIPSAQQATGSLVTQACNGIDISVTIGTASNVTPSSTGDLAALNHQIINTGGYLNASVTISYTGENYVDGPMEVTFGDIVITSTSAVDTSLIPVAPSQSVNSEFLMDSTGTLFAYSGSGGSIIIPNTLPITTVTATVDMAPCIEDARGDTVEEKTARCQAIESEAVSAYLEYLEDPDTFEEDYSYISFSVTTNTNQTATVTAIGSESFERRNITSVTIPNSVTTIGEHAFAHNSITTVVIGSGITSIGRGAFYNDEGSVLTSVSIGAACDTYETEFTDDEQFVWANGYTNSDIVWGTACS